MHAIDGMTITAELREGVLDLVDRLGPGQLVVSPGWQEFVANVGIAPIMSRTSPSNRNDRRQTADGASQAVGPRALVIGPPAAVLKHGAIATAEFGFVTVVAQLARRWQRAATWRDDTSLDLWKQGWTPQTIDRITVPGQESVVEFLVARARRTPTVVDPSVE